MGIYNCTQWKMNKILEILCYFNVIIGVFLITNAIIQQQLDFKMKHLELSKIVVDIAFSFFLSIGISLIFISLVGFIGYKRKISYLITAYNFSTIILLIIFSIFIIVQFSSKNHLARYDEDKNCNYDPILQDYKSIYQQGKNLICSIECPCTADIVSFSHKDISSFYIDYSPNGADRVSTCKNYLEKMNAQLERNINQIRAYKREIIDALETLENTFGCSGFCSVNNHFVFRNINSGKTNQEDCKEQMISFLKQKSEINIKFGSIIFSYIFILCFLSIFAAIQPQKNNQINQLNQNDIIDLEQKKENNQFEKPQMELSSSTKSSCITLSILPNQQTSYMVSSPLFIQQQQLTFNTQQLVTDQIQPAIIDERNEGDRFQKIKD